MVMFESKQLRQMRELVEADTDTNVRVDEVPRNFDPGARLSGTDDGDKT